MMTIKAMPVAANNDAELVSATLSGNRDAFAQIVTRYQSLVCSLAYSATGSLGQSEDLAQETFITAWKHLGHLHDRDKLRSWLCGIARNRINNFLRREGCEPNHQAEPLDEIHDSQSPEPQPVEHTITREEEAILWRALERIPEIYREPLVLFYREHKSIEAVASNLDLTEDAAKQRLSRGRKLLQEQVLAFVEGALEHTKPDKAFTLGVLAALPLVATMAKTATASVAIKGGSTVKAATSLTMLGTVLTAGILFLFSLLAFLAFTGGCIGYMMGRACAHSARQLEHVVRFWRAVAIGFGVFLVFPFLLAVVLHLSAKTHPQLWHGMTWWLGVLYIFVPAVLTTWIWRWWRGLREPETTATTPVKPLKKRFALWLTLGMIVPTGILVLFLYSMVFQACWSAQRITETQFQKIVAAHKEAKYWVEQDKNGTKTLWFKLSENRGRVTYFIPADKSTLALLDKNGIAYSTSVEGQGSERLGVPGRLLGFLSFFIAPLGLVILLRRPWHQEFLRVETELRRDERAAKFAFKAFAVSVALVMLAAAVLLGMVTRWKVRTLSAAEVPKIVAKMKGAQFEIYQFNNGTKELWISHYRHPDFIAKANDATLALLTAKGIHFKTYVQGRDFGHATPKPAIALLCISFLAISAGIVLWWVSPRTVAVLGAVMLIAIGILLGMITPWHTKSLSSAAAQKMISDHQVACYEVVKYSNGSRELLITPPWSRHRSRFIAPANDSTLALLKANKIAFHTAMQGRDFGYRVPTRGKSLLWISLMTTGATGLLWWAVKRRKALACANGGN